ncbi:MAG: chemotaxis-specific protein-glutamate methyltransferase CheB [Thermoplasmatota archaeon]
MPSQKYKAVVVDDSNFMVTILSDILESDERIEVIETGSNGEEAVRLNKELNPDVILLDIEMPKMDGLEATKKIMSDKPTPIVILSAMGDKVANMAVKALDAGAVDFISKTSGSLSMDIRKKSDEILNKLIKAAESSPKSLKEREDMENEAEKTKKFKPKKQKYIVTIASSTGGTRALDDLLSVIPPNFPAPIVVVQHMPPKFTSHLARTLNTKYSIDVKEAEKHEIIKKNHVYIIPAGHHGVIKNWDDETFISLNKKPKLHGVRPAADYLLQSAAEVFGSKAVGVILTGMGKDGAEGAKIIKNNHGYVAVQDEDSCVVFGMPKTTIEYTNIDFVGNPKQIGNKLNSLMMEEIN